MSEVVTKEAITAVIPSKGGRVFHWQVDADNKCYYGTAKTELLARRIMTLIVKGLCYETKSTYLDQAGNGE